MRDRAGDWGEALLEGDCGVGAGPSRMTLTVNHGVGFAIQATGLGAHSREFAPRIAHLLAFSSSFSFSHLVQCPSMVLST
jgi:hypothetical protein